MGTPKDGTVIALEDSRTARANDTARNDQSFIASASTRNSNKKNLHEAIQNSDLLQITQPMGHDYTILAVQENLPKELRLLLRAVTILVF